MHYKELPGNWYMNYNSDFSGDILVRGNGQSAEIPFEVIKAIVDTEEQLRVYRKLDPYRKPPEGTE